jgi:hydrogenase/urease accessory protein HupE
MHPFKIPVRHVSVLAMLLCALLFWPQSLRAHEILPTIADLSVQDNGALRMDFRVNIEALLSGIDLDAVVDTDASDKANDYDALRALPAEDLSQQLPKLITRWNELGLLQAGGAALNVQNIALDIPEGLSDDLPRVSLLSVEALLPAGVTKVIVSWPAGSGALVVRQQGVETPYTGYLEGGASSPEIDLGGGGAQTPTAAFFSYLPVGFDHIIPKGLDHILFVLGLFLLSTRMRPLLWQVSAFTLAHTVTLALGALGWVSVPGSIVEPLIAASIVFVAIENVFSPRLNRWRPVVIFGFGLLHGLGFASVLGEFGLPEDQFLPALIGFNVGVELGQLTVIGLAALMLWGCVALARRASLTEAEQPVTTYPVMFRAVSIPASLIIAMIGAYWCIERIFL